MADLGTVAVTVGSVLATNIINFYIIKRRDDSEAKKDWRSTTGQAYLDAAQALRHYVYWISNVAMAYARNTAGNDPHFISTVDADRKFGEASLELTDAGEVLDHRGSPEVARLFKAAKKSAENLFRLRADGHAPDLDHNVDPETDPKPWATAHRQYTAAFNAMKLQMSAEREKYSPYSARS